MSKKSNAPKCRNTIEASNQTVKKNIAKSCKVGITAFDKWGVEPIERAGREAFYDVASVVRNRVDNELSKIVEQGGDIDDAELLQARIRLTNAQADAQEL